MNIHEHQAKEILKQYGAPVSNGVVILNNSEIDNKINLLKSKEFVVKAQIHAGGRGKAGGIKLIHSPLEAKQFAASILGKNLITSQNKPAGQPVNMLLIEETINVKKEMYFSILVDRQTESIVVITSESGGMEIEEIANKDLGLIIKEYYKSK